MAHRTWPTLAATLLAAALATKPAAAAHAGFASLPVPYHDKTLEGAIWYPTDANPTPLAIGPYTMPVATAAPVAGHNLPLIVISHGNGGSMLGHDDTALALAQSGFVVASITHDRDNFRDHANELRLWERPPQISALIDAALHAWPGHAAIDPARIGMFGFSAGGFTTLVAIGGRPDFTRIAPYCATHAATFVCTIQPAHDRMPKLPASPDPWHADPRIRAAVIAAPALGFTFTPAGLAAVKVPIQLWAAAQDRVLPVADNALAVRAALPSPPDFHMVAGTDHFGFLPPCSPALREAAPAICRDPAGFDRAAFHAAFNTAIVAFFDRTLGR